MTFEQIVRKKADCSIDVLYRICRYQRIDRLKVPLVPSTNDQFLGRNNRDHGVAQAIDERRYGVVTARNIDHDVRIEEKASHAPLAAWIIPEPVHVLDAVADVNAVLPHAEERMIFDGLALARWILLNRDMYFNDGPLFDLDSFKRPEDAVFLLGWNRAHFGC